MGIIFYGPVMVIGGSISPASLKRQEEVLLVAKLE